MSDTLSKARSDAWDASLTDAQRWTIYARFRRAPWFQVSKWIAEEYALEAPSRTALYRWAARMRGLESAYRIEQAITAREEAGDLAAAAGQDDALRIEAYKAMAQEIALRTGDASSAGKFLKMALGLAAAQTKRAELQLKAAAQGTKDEALRLAREKFEALERRAAAARDALVKAAAGAGLTPEARKQIEEAMGLL
jgi:hypothetical protein